MQKLYLECPQKPKDRVSVLFKVSEKKSVRAFQPACPRTKLISRTTLPYAPHVMGLKFLFGWIKITENPILNQK